jgi:hypothetical protein
MPSKQSSTTDSKVSPKPSPSSSTKPPNNSTNKSKPGAPDPLEKSPTSSSTPWMKMSATTFQSQRTRPLPPKIHHPRCPRRTQSRAQNRLSIQPLATLPIPPPAKRPGRRPQAHHAPSRRRRHPRHFNAPSLEEAREQLENLHKQIRRRTKVVSLFPNKESGLRLIASILMESSDDWESGRSSLNPGHLSSQNNQTETQTINLMRIDTFTEKNCAAESGSLCEGKTRWSY